MATTRNLLSMTLNPNSLTKLCEQHLRAISQRNAYTGKRACFHGNTGGRGSDSLIVRHERKIDLQICRELAPKRLGALFRKST